MIGSLFTPLLAREICKTLNVSSHHIWALLYNMTDLLTVLYYTFTTISQYNYVQSTCYSLNRCRFYMAR